MLAEDSSFVYFQQLHEVLLRVGRAKREYLDVQEGKLISVFKKPKDKSLSSIVEFIKTSIVAHSSEMGRSLEEYRKIKERFVDFQQDIELIRKKYFAHVKTSWRRLRMLFFSDCARAEKKNDRAFQELIEYLNQECDIIHQVSIILIKLMPLVEDLTEVCIKEESEHVAPEKLKEVLIPVLDVFIHMPNQKHQLEVRKFLQKAYPKLPLSLIPDSLKKQNEMLDVLKEDRWSQLESQEAKKRFALAESVKTAKEVIDCWPKTYRITSLNQLKKNLLSLLKIYDRLEKAMLPLDALAYLYQKSPGLPGGLISRDPSLRKEMEKRLIERRPIAYLIERNTSKMLMTIWETQENLMDAVDIWFAEWDKTLVEVDGMRLKQSLLHIVQAFKALEELITKKEALEVVKSHCPLFPEEILLLNADSLNLLLAKLKAKQSIASHFSERKLQEQFHFIEEKENLVHFATRIDAFWKSFQSPETLKKSFEGYIEAYLNLEKKMLNKEIKSILLFKFPHFPSLMLSDSHDVLIKMLEDLKGNRPIAKYIEVSLRRYLPYLLREPHPPIKDFNVIKKGSLVVIQDEKELKSHNGMIRVPMQHLASLIQFFGRNKTPSVSLLVDCQNQNLTHEFWRSLIDLALRNDVISLVLIHLNNVLTIPHFHKEEKNNLMKVMEKITFPDPVTFDPQKIHLLDQDAISFFSRFSSFLTSSDRSLNFKGCSLDLIRQVFPKFRAIKKVDFSYTAINQEDLEIWKAQGLFEEVRRIGLLSCANLNADLISVLAGCPSLQQVELSRNLLLGKVPLHQLPKSDNPLQILQWYGQSSTLWKFALQMYNGPQEFATCLQIVLAKKGDRGASLFYPECTILDPDSVNFWLFQETYLTMPQNPYIKVIRANFTHLLHNERILSFIEKFPNLETLIVSQEIPEQFLAVLIKSHPDLEIKIEPISAEEEWRDEISIEHVLDHYRQALKDKNGDKMRYCRLFIETFASEEVKNRVYHQETLLLPLPLQAA